jgi:protein involved in polysaccharide export with SLBB domain
VVLIWLISIASVTLAQTGAAALAEPLAPAPVFKYYVWGQVRAPGAYRLSANPDVIELLSVCGGPTDQADLNHVTLIRGVDQKRVPLNLKQALGSGQVISVTPGDVLIVPRSLWYSVRDELVVVTTLAVFANLYFTIANGARK